MNRRPGEGQTVLLTGASGGIGLELARCFAEGGYNLVLVARSAEALDAAAASLAREFGVSAHAIARDLGQPGAGEELAQTIAGRALDVDVLVNNAGYGIASPFAEGDLHTQLGMVDLNVRGLVELTHLFWPRMLKNKRGGVLNVASTAAFQPGPFMAVYCATKAFVLSFSEALWEEARGTGVHVSCLCPGATESGFHKRAGTEKLNLVRAGMMSSARAARLGYEAFQANKRVKVAGAGNALMAASVGFVPRPLVLRVTRKLLSA
ncbi:MAG: SDR family oxidoreductase [Rhodomicrobium sp.]